MPRLITAMLVRNEADKYLERALKRCLEFSTDVLVLDDGSTDGSDRLAWRLGCTVKYRSGETMWGAESPARAELWDFGAESCGKDGWLLICDADMLLYGDPRPLMLTTQHNAWSWVLHDCWNDERYYRTDGYWKGHVHPRPWFFKPSALDCDPPLWPDRGLHVGHCPANAKIRAGIAPYPLYFWNHLSYVKLQDRIKKRDQYLEQAPLLSSFELAHARSVGD